jgi:hypothetical protein
MLNVHVSYSEWYPRLDNFTAQSKNFSQEMLDTFSNTRDDCSVKNVGTAYQL